MTNKIIGILAAAVVVLAVVAYNLWQQQGQTEPQRAELTQPAVKPEQPALSLEATQPEEVQKDESAAMSTLDAEPQNKNGDEDELKLCQLAHQYDDWYRKGDHYESDTFMQDVKNWAFARGYFETEYAQGAVGIKKKSDYDYYDMDALENMAQAGDSMANVRLAYRLYLKGDKESMQRAQPYCDRAIADGYTALIICKSSHLVRQIYDERKKEDDKKDQERLRQLELDFQAWRRVAVEFGDQLGEELSSNILGDTEFEFDEETLQAQTQKLIQDVMRQRQMLGLGSMEHPPMPELLVHVLNNEVESEEALNVCFE
ncbi:hypothetical protein [Kangiella shandongensis]|uniref:hypothetical protein n=1 Tax=Kangiella shandongensis TaxID=2763258 RepID=UPI001CBB4BC4|nr:hypothetical protein [Kangiella shandongensis]